MANKIKVTGKAQNSAALGVVVAYLKLHPKTSLKGLRRVFPNSTAPDKGVDELFLPLAEAEAVNKEHDMSLYFTKDGRTIELSDGSEIALSQIWTAKSLDNIKSIARKNGIDVEVDKSRDTDKCGYSIEGLGRKKKGGWLKRILWLLVLLIIAALVVVFFVVKK